MSLADHIERVAGAVSSGAGALWTPGEILAWLEGSERVFCRVVDGETRAHAELHRTKQPHRWQVSCAVEPDYQGRGLGRLVLSEALAWADAHGAEYVDGQALASNQRVLALDFSLGFIEVGRVRDWTRYAGHSDDLVLLSRKRGEPCSEH